MQIHLSDHFNYNKLIRFCFPPIMMMVFTSIYGVVDGFFVSNYVGKTSFAAVNLIMPFIMILGGFGFMVGTGGSALVGKTLGEGKKETASRYFSMLITFTFLVGIFLSVLGILFIRPIAYLLGATTVIIEDCVTYGRILLVFNVAFMLQSTFQTFLSTAEKPKLGLSITLIAGFTNIILDALFIAVFHWGVVGAALATGLSEFVGAILPFLYFVCPNRSLLRFHIVPLHKSVLRKTCTNGASELMSNISTSLVSMVYNFQLLKFAGENGVAAYGVLMYVQFVFIAIFIGYTIGIGPVISFHFGAGNHTELRNLLKKSLFLTTCTGIVMMILARTLALPLSRLFVGYDTRLLEMTTQAFQIFAFSFLLAGVNIFASAFFTSLSNGGISAAISFLRTLVFQMLCVIFLPFLFGLNGIWWAITVAEVFACIVSFAFLFAKRKKYHYM